ncbi:MAG: HAD-IC family P-type ATPase [Acidimicrobiales bacterium]|nr:HAD-IC family P-type ATPase [Acidimicrobiales bacterium]
MPGSEAVDGATRAPAGITGLTAVEVEERVRDGRVNAVPTSPGRTVGQIVRANVLTPVNGIIGSLFVVVLVVAPGPDLLFAGVVIANSLIGIVQEARARRALARLAVLNAPHARVVRDGVVRELAVEEVVADDVIELQPGDQVVVDGEVVLGRGLEVDESLLTGEAEPVPKSEADEVLSGSFVAAGSGVFRATRVGAEAYAVRLAEEAKRFSLVRSELRDGVNWLLRRLVVVIPPLALLLLWDLHDHDGDWTEAILGTVAAAVSMVPDGLVLLTSVAFIVGVLELARRQALAKELASVELLARVSVLCLDKTGTITTGEIAFSELQVLDGADDGADGVAAALGALAVADPTPNATLRALGARFGPPAGWAPDEVVPFSSARKWSGASFPERGTWLLGAPEVLLPPGEARVRALVTAEAEAGRRVVLLARAPAGPLDPDLLPDRRSPAALVLLEDQVRPDAAEILRYFTDQGVRLKVISGDHPATVAAVARRAGVPHVGRPVDARTLPVEPAALAASVAAATVFGRVTPHQKREMVHALQSRGETVAMTGDGVNDVLALKDSDMGIAMGSGSAATRAVAELVLLDNRFATLPTVLAAGRRVFNNMERVANLFVNKTSYAVLLALLVVATAVEYPFLPRHLTLVGSLSIGIPGFVLSFAPNTRRAVPGFIGRVLRFSLPSGFVCGMCTFWVFWVLRRRLTDTVTLDEARTAATLVLLWAALLVLAKLARPLSAWRLGLVLSMFGCYLGVLAIPALRGFFALDLPPTSAWWVPGVGLLVATVALLAGPRLVPWWGRGDAAQALPAVGGDDTRAG